MARRRVEDEGELKARRVYQKIENSSNTVFNYKKKKDPMSHGPTEIAKYSEEEGKEG